MQNLPTPTSVYAKFWEQPKPDEIALDDETASMSQESFDKLKHYQTSNPTGVWLGKMWRRDNELFWYGESQNPAFCKLFHLPIKIV